MIADLLQLSSISKINTGYVLLDFVAVLVFGLALKAFQRFDVLENLRQLSFFDVVRTVQHTKFSYANYAWSCGNDLEVANNVLLNAIVYYINRVAQVKFRDSEIFLMQLPHEDRTFDTADIMIVPGRWRWTHVASHRGCDIALTRSVEQTTGDDRGLAVKSMTEKYTIRARGHGDKDAAINEFLGRAHAAYKDYIKSRLSEDKRFFFACVRGRDEDGVEKMVFKKHKMASTKKLEHVAHPAVPRIRGILTDLMTSSGKFAVDGHAQKATFLLHGPPGTGKTSLIKAIANFTNRHIISVNLANIQTSEEFMDVMFADRIGTLGSDVKVKNDEVIFVMEDIDAACDVVKDRAQAPARKPKAPAKDPDAVADAVADAFVNRDPLTLATILNVLDGALESEKRIVIMTTNYVDRLDRALVRPGRITVNLEMGNINGENAMQMISRYFPGDPAPLMRADLDALLEDQFVTPAELEMLCAHHATRDEVLAALAAKPHTAQKPK